MKKEEVHENKTSQGYKKLKIYFEEISKSEKFQTKVIELRKKHRIPLVGLSLDKKFDELAHMRLSVEAHLLCNELKLYSDPWQEIMKHYIVYNEFWVNPDLYSFDLCLITDQLLPIGDEGIGEPKLFFNGLNRDFTSSYPVAVVVSPYASKRDILDFIKAHFRGIELLQNKYKNLDIKIGKFKEKRKEERNRFIFENKEKPRKTIARLVSKIFGETLDVGHVGKIISLENKKRKKA